MQAKMAELESRKEAMAIQAQIAAMDSETKQANTAYQIERERAEAEQQMIARQYDREIQMAKMQQDGVLTQEELASRERLKMIDIDTKRQLFNAEAALRVNTGAGL